MGTHFHPLGSRYELVDPWQREAAFFDVRLASRFDDFGVDEHNERVPALRDIDHDHPFMHVDLGGRKPDAGRGIHGLGHVGHQLLQARIEYGDRGSQLMQPCIWVSEDVQDRHLKPNLFAN